MITIRYCKCQVCWSHACYRCLGHHVFIVSSLLLLWTHIEEHNFGLKLKLKCAWSFFALPLIQYSICRAVRPESCVKKKEDESPPNRLAEIGQPEEILAKESSWNQHRLVLKLASCWDSQQDGWTAGMRIVDVCHYGLPISHWHWLTTVTEMHLDFILAI